MRLIRHNSRPFYVLASGGGIGYWRDVFKGYPEDGKGGRWTPHLSLATRYTRAEMRAGVNAPAGVWLTRADADKIEHPRNAPTR